MEANRSTYWQVPIAMGTCFALLLTGCSDGLSSTSELPVEPVPHVVNADIQAGIEAHIDALSQTHAGGFPLTVDGQPLALKLVRIHTEYLATLGPREHFACVDLVDEKGDVYDVDFFMSGDPGDMTVTETIPHKVNGKPFYFWQQNPDKSWGRVAIDEASQQLMGIIVPEDAFEFRYLVTLPEISGPARVWIPLPQSDDFQTVTLSSARSPHPHRVLDEPRHGNKALFWELTPADSGKVIDLRYDVTRLEKSAYPVGDDHPPRYLAPERLVPNDEKFVAIAKQATAGRDSDLQRARALYDLVIEELRYAKAGPGWGQGDARFACDSRHGNCTDFHAYFIGLARAIGIPARFAIGAAIPSNRNDGGVDGYHCWVEFYADDKWWPVDISEADKYSNLSSYYFGHHPANRLEFSRGRDLLFDPGPADGPINFFAYPILEIDGASQALRPSFSFTRPPP
jgi:hypothetical protein